jgi:hypothetical protein
LPSTQPWPTVIQTDSQVHFIKPFPTPSPTRVQRSFREMRTHSSQNPRRPETNCHNCLLYGKPEEKYVAAKWRKPPVKTALNPKLSRENNRRHPLPTLCQFGRTERKKRTDVLQAVSLQVPTKKHRRTNPTIEWKWLARARARAREARSNPTCTH